MKHKISIYDLCSLQTYSAVDEKFDLLIQSLNVCDRLCCNWCVKDTAENYKIENFGRSENIVLHINKDKKYDMLKKTHYVKIDEEDYAKIIEIKLVVI